MKKTVHVPLFEQFCKEEDLKIVEGKSPELIDVESIVPTQKDLDRAQGLEFQGSTFFGNGAPYQGEANKMAKLIKDNEKLVRRAKAVIEIWGTRDYEGLSDGGRKTHPANCWRPFADALEDAGFSSEQISSIRNYEPVEAEEVD